MAMRIKSLREAANLTQVQLADKIGRAFYSRIQLGNWSGTAQNGNLAPVS